MATRTISKKAAEVRERWWEKRNYYLNREADGVFDWLLDLILEDTEEYYWYPLEVYLRDDETTIQTIRPHHPIQTYCLTPVLRNIDRDTFFKVLKTTVENEKGYKATIEYCDNFCDSGSKAIIFKVAIE